MFLSIIIPALNSSVYLPECLSALKDSCPAQSEIIVVDDASGDDSVSIASQMGVRVLQLFQNSGPAAARNHGAHHAHGDVLFFVDADVVVAEDATAKVLRQFDQQPELAALFGSYDARPREKGLVSQYRNLLHHFVHQNGNPEASTFWAGCGAIRRSVFEKFGGFDEKNFRRPSIEDIELGCRLRQAGYRILLDKTLQGTHLKRWDFCSLLRTDVTSRAIPWSRLILETRKTPDDLNLKWGQRVSFGLTALALAFAVLSPMAPRLLVLCGAALLTVLFLNRKLYAFFLRQKGLLFTARCVPLHLLYFVYSGLSYLYVWCEFQLKRDRFRSEGPVRRQPL
jgi:glycosyltransferase involved in cell wall biosynthesis